LITKILFGEIHPGELPLVDQLSQTLRQELPEEAQVVCPLTLGGHVDHRLTRRAAELLGRRLWFYADYPYVVRSADPFQAILPADWTSQVFPVSEAGLAAWQAAIAAHQSQISTFWSSTGVMEAAMREYWLAEGGVRLWKNAV
jgi:LmbE family N-acetylglucosaminyl deacetylase